MSSSLSSTEMATDLVCNAVWRCHPCPCLSLPPGVLMEDLGSAGGGCREAGVGEGWARYRQRRGLPEPVFKRSAYLKNGGHGAQRAVGTQSVCEVCKGDGCGGWGAASAMKLHTYGDVDGGQQRPSALYHTGRGPTNPHTPSRQTRPKIPRPSPDSRSQPEPNGAVQTHWEHAAK